MTPDERRSQLLDVGRDVFSTNDFETVSMTDIADAAGVTRALVYHYFPTKADLFAGIWAREHTTLRATDTGETARDRIVALLTAYLDFYADNLPLLLIANRSSIASSPTVRQPIQQNFADMCTALLDGVGATGNKRRLAEAAFVGWIAYVRETTLLALESGAITPAENLAMCIDALDGTVGKLVDLTTPDSSRRAP